MMMMRSKDGKVRRWGGKRQYRKPQLTRCFCSSSLNTNRIKRTSSSSSSLPNGAPRRPNDGATQATNIEQYIPATSLVGSGLAWTHRRRTTTDNNNNYTKRLCGKIVKRSHLMLIWFIARDLDICLGRVCASLRRHGLKARGIVSVGR